MTKLRLDTLQQKQACSSQVRLFKQLFGEAVDITEELCATHASAFDWNWAARNLLSPKKFKEYVRADKLAWNEYERVKKLAWNEYERVINPASDEYVRVDKLVLNKYECVEKSAWNEYERVINPASDEYVRVDKLALDEYKRINARAWAKLYNNESR